MILKHYNPVFQAAEPFCLDLTADDSASPIATVTDLITKVFDLKRELENPIHGMSGLDPGDKGATYYRGERELFDRPLTPLVGRDGWTLERERNYLHRFRRRSYSHQNRVLSEWETIFLARHYLLPTRLLDWSGNPLVALYFACQSKDDDAPLDGCVWALVRQPHEAYDVNVFDRPPWSRYGKGSEFRFAIPGVKLIYPFYVAPRMTAQSCIFTIQDDPQKSLSQYEPATQDRENFDLFHLRRWRVPGKEKRSILGKLAILDISQRSLFPDVQGLGEGIAPLDEMLNRSR